MAIVSGQDQQTIPQSMSRPKEPPLFIRSLLQKSAIVHAISCSMIPPHLLPTYLSQSNNHSSSYNNSNSRHQHRQLIVATDTTLQLFALDQPTSSLHPLTDVVLFTRAVQLASIPGNSPGTDLLVVLTKNSRMAVFKFQPSNTTLRVVLSLDLAPSSQLPFNNYNRHHYRLLTVHPHRKLIALAAVESFLAVIAINNNSHTAPRRLSVDGLILALDFLEDDGGDSILLLLLQRGKKQVIALYTVAVGGSSNPLDPPLVTCTGVMVNCATALDERAVARATSALTGAAPPSVYTQHAVAVTRLVGRPFLFAVFARGRVIAGDARAVITRAKSGDRTTTTVRLQDSPRRGGSSSTNQNSLNTPESPETRHIREVITRAGHRSNTNYNRNPSSSISEVDNHHVISADQTENTNDAHVHTSTLGLDSQFAPLPLIQMDDGEDQNQTQNPSTTVNTIPSADLSHSIDNAEQSGMQTPTGSNRSDDETPTNSNEGFITPTQTPTNNMGEPPAVLMPSRRARYNGREESPPMPSYTWCLSAGDSGYTRQEDRPSGEDFLLYLHVPSYITMEISSEHGMVMSYIFAGDHFREEGQDVNGLYFVMETGALFVLKWCDWAREGTTTFRIPTSDRFSSSVRESFNVEYIGDVGPANSIVALHDRFLFVSNDGADGSLRQIQLPKSNNNVSPTSRTNRQMVNRLIGGWYGAGRYGLEVKQEFINLAPISDFAILSTSAKSRSDGELTSRRREKKRARRQLQNRTQQTPGTSGQSQLREDSSAGSSLSQYLEKDPTIVACCGMDSQGSLRFIRPGTPVSLLASAENQFPACNNIWPIRTSTTAIYDFGIAMSFAQGTGFLISLPPINKDARSEHGTIANLVNGTDAVGIYSEHRTLFIGTLHDGILVQICESRVRLIQLKQRQNANILDNVTDGYLTMSLCERSIDWFPPEGRFISVGTVGAGFILLCVLPGQEEKADLLLLRLNSERFELELGSAVSIERELSCVSIPQWCIPSNESPSGRGTQIAILGTYAPSVEIRALKPGLPLLDKCITSPWHTLEVKCKKKKDSRNKQLDMTEQIGRDFMTTTHERIPSNDSELYTDPSTGLMHMTAVPESLSPMERGEMKFVFVGLRDGSAVTFLVQVNSNSAISSDSHITQQMLRIYLHRKLGNCPVSISTASMAIQEVVFGLTDKAWVCQNNGNKRFKWTQLAFPPTRAICSFSVLGAERCFAAVGENGTFYICGMRNREQVSVSSILLKATPRRVINLPSLPEYVIVAVTKPIPKFQTLPHAAFRPISDANKPRKRDIYCELRVYNQYSHKLRGYEALSENEVVRFLLSWHDFMVVGTSFEIKPNENSTAAREIDRGRLILYSVRRTISRRMTGKRRIQFEVISEIILPGAVTAGAVHPSGEILVVSCNNKIFVFGLTPSGSAIVELARRSTRTPIVSISVLADVICVVDQKDSVAYYQLVAGTGKLERDRGDHQRRDITDTILVSRTLAVAVDSHGSLMTIGYEKDDAPSQSESSTHDWSIILKSSDNSLIDNYFPGVEAALHENPMPITTAEGDVGEGMNMIASNELGQEYDVIPQESESDGSENQEENGEVGNDADSSGSGMLEVDDANQPADDNGMNNQTTEQDQGNQLQTVIVGDGEEIQAGAFEEDNNDANEDQVMLDQPMTILPDAEVTNVTRSAVPRFLVRHHNFDMRDVALRLQHGRFSRDEKIDDVERDCGLTNQKFKMSLLSKPCSGIFCGTLGGAIIVGVPMSEETYELLKGVQENLLRHPIMTDSMIRDECIDYRSIQRTKSERTIDGDLVERFRSLDLESKKRICENVGIDGEDGYLCIEAVLDELVDKIG